MKLPSAFCIPEPLPVHTGIKGRQVHPLIRFYAEEPRTSPWQPAMVQDCGMVKVKVQGQGFFICHMINYTGYNQK